MIVTTAPVSTPSAARTALRGEFVGSHTTRSGIGVTTSGSVIAPRVVEIVTGPPSTAPISTAVASDSRATGTCRVPAR